MIHFESSSRSSAVSTWEKQLFKERWLPFTAPDPYSNPPLAPRDAAAQLQTQLDAPPAAAPAPSPERTTCLT